MNDLGGVLRVMSGLAADGIRSWMFGGWAEELRGLSPVREHRDVDLLYQGSDFGPVDEVIERRRVHEIPAKRLAHKRALVVNGVMIELFLVRTDHDGTPYTFFWDRLRYDWPSDTFGFVDCIAVASASALQRYRADYGSIRAAAAR
jgi:hypothetical protein